MSEPTKYRCPRCRFDHDVMKQPLGKTIRNPAALSAGPVLDDCKACSGTGYIPDAVCEAIAKSFKDHEEILRTLQWSMDHFSFNRWGMYVGVELDGYIHT